MNCVINIISIVIMEATGSNTANMASSTNNAFNVLMAHRGPASITRAPATGIAFILIVEVANGTAGTAPRDSSQSASVHAVPAVPAVASLPLGFLEKLDCTVILKDRTAENYSSAISAAITDDIGRSCPNDVAPPRSIPIIFATCLSQLNSDFRKTYKELGIFYKSALKVQYYPLSITF